MLKRAITYETFDGEKVTEDFYFNLTKSELSKMQLSQTGGLENKIRKIMNSRDLPEIINLFQDIILLSYGEKSADGKRFEKVRDGHKLAEDFMQSAAYDVLYMELSTDSKKATEFINGIIPKEIRDSVAAEQKKQLEQVANASAN